MATETYTYKVGDQFVDFSCFDAGQYQGVISRIRAAARERARSKAEEIPLVRSERAQFLLDNEPDSIGVPQIWRYCDDDEGSRSILVGSLLAAGRKDEEAKELVLKIPPADRAEIAKHILGLVKLASAKKDGNV